jgi:hypothetical protein
MTFILSKLYNRILNICNIISNDFYTYKLFVPFYWHKSRHEDQYKRIDDPDTNPQKYSHQIFHKGAQNMCWRKKTASSTNGAGKTGFLPAED